MTVVAPREVLVDGKTPGTVSLIVWGAAQRVQYDVAVAPAITQLQQQFRNLFPGEDINVTINDEATTLTGNVSSNAIMLRAGEIAEKTSSKTTVINLLQVPGGAQSQQVLLQVRFAEVNRQALKEAGSSSSPGQSRTRRPDTTEQFSASPIYREGRDADVQRLPEPLRLQHRAQRRRPHQGAPDARAFSRAWPSRT